MILQTIDCGFSNTDNWSFRCSWIFCWSLGYDRTKVWERLIFNIPDSKRKFWQQDCNCWRNSRKTSNGGIYNWHE